MELCKTEGTGNGWKHIKELEEETFLIRKHRWECSANIENCWMIAKCEKIKQDERPGNKGKETASAEEWRKETLREHYWEMLKEQGWKRHGEEVRELKVDVNITRNRIKTMTNFLVIVEFCNLWTVLMEETSTAHERGSVSQSDIESMDEMVAEREICLHLDFWKVTRHLNSWNVRTFDHVTSFLTKI